MTKARLHEIIFEADTRAGKAFDVVLLVLILGSVLVVSLETIPSYQKQFGQLFFVLEWVFTILFTLEYILRLYTTYQPKKYATSFFGVVDLAAILPTYLSLFIVGTHSLAVIRALRLLRVFRVFKMAGFLHQGEVIATALRNSRQKIIVFLFFIVQLVIIFGSIMYLLEGEVNENFDSIPRSIYWAIVTLTTVGYGDITPVTTMGQFVASAIMILGYSVIAVPTGIVTSQVIKADNKISTQVCPNCSQEGHDHDADYCKYCGHEMKGT